MKKFNIQTQIYDWAKKSERLRNSGAVGAPHAIKK